MYGGLYHNTVSGGLYHNTVSSGLYHNTVSGGLYHNTVSSGYICVCMYVCVSVCVLIMTTPYINFTYLLMYTKFDAGVCESTNKQ